MIRPDIILSFYRLRASYTRYFCEHLHLHGFRDLYRAKSRGVKYLWTLVLLLAIATLTYEAYVSITQYLEQPMIVTQQVKTIHERRIPDVLVCPFSRFNPALVKKAHLSLEAAEHLQTVFDLSAVNVVLSDRNKFLWKSMQADKRREQQRLENEISGVLIRQNVTLLELIHKLSYRCNDFISHCFSMRRMYDCCNGSRPYFTHMALCYQLRGVLQPSPGFGYGLTVLGKSPRGLNDHTPRKDYVTPQGLILKLVEPGRGIGYDITFIPAGSHGLIPIRSMRVEFEYDAKHSSCEPAPNYSTTTCFNWCVFSEVMRICNCSPIVTARSGVLPLCSPLRLSDCYRTIRKNNRNEQRLSTERAIECHKRCKQPCSHWQYEPTVSYTAFPSSTYEMNLREMEELEEGKLQDAMEDFTLLVDIFFETLDYTIIRLAPQMSVVTFIANMGGHLLLWLGASVVTVAQLIIFLVYTTWTAARGSQPTLLTGAVPTASRDEANLQRKLTDTLTLNSSLKKHDRRTRRTSSGRSEKAETNSECFQSLIDPYWAVQHRQLPRLRRGSQQEEYL